MRYLGAALIFWDSSFHFFFPEANTTMRTFKNLAVLGLASVSLAFAGCGETRNEFEIKGTVTINGAPIQNGTISFVAADGIAQTSGGQITDGAYQAMVPPGPKIVEVLGNEVAGEEPLYKGVPNSPTRKVLKTVTPTIYGAASTSTLKTTITGNSGDVNFNLEGKPPTAAELKAR